MKIISKLCIIAGVFLFLAVSASYLLKSDFTSFILWWLVLLALGVIFMPLTDKVMGDFFDGGFLFSKIIGLAVSGYLMWLLSSLRILKFTPLSCIMVVILCLIMNALIFFLKDKGNKKSPKVFYSSDKLNRILAEEMMFLAIFLIWTYIRGFKPEAHGTEKFMDYGFMTTMMRADYMPPVDLWFSGKSINYYYVGQYLATFMTKLSHIKVSVGYNLMLMSIAAFGFMLPFSLVYNLIKHYGIEHNKGYKKAPVMGGLLAGGAVSLAGNLHFTLFYFVVPMIKEILGMEKGDNYWFPNSTRYIGYHPETDDKTIHEFPSYSFILGDLHAHVINIIFVITVLGILYGFIRYKKKIIDNPQFIKGRGIFDIITPHILLISFFIGLFHTTNFWDFPIYYVVSGSIILFMNIKQYYGIKKIFCITAIQGIFVMVAAKIIALPFTLGFKQISSVPVFTEARTPLYQLLILWGLPVYFVFSLLWYLIQFFRENFILKEDKKKKEKTWTLTQFIRTMEVQDLFVIAIGLCAVGLVLVPEVIYIQDIYSGHKRANTMFKLTYQAFIMFGIALGYIFVKFKVHSKYYFSKTVGYLMFFLFLTSLWYTKVSVNAWYGNIFKINNYKGIDAAAFMEQSMEEDHLAVTWLNENVKGLPVVLEANGDSYSDYQRVSVMTGLPTIIGWGTHEHLWRGDYSLVDERAVDVEAIYTGEDEEAVISLLKLYNVQYIYVGKLEYKKYDFVNDEMLKSLGEVVFENGKTYIVKVNP